MSWLSSITHTEGLTPDFVKKIGDTIGGTVVNAIPGGSVINSMFDLTNTHGGGPSPVDLYTQTQANLHAQASAAVRAGSAAARVTGAGQAAATDVGSAFAILTSSPAGLLILVLVGFLLLRRK